MKNKRPSQLEDHLGYWLRCLSNLVSHSFADRLEKHGVSVPQWVVLRCLHDAEDTSLNELAATVGVDNGALSRMMERLLQKGLIVRETDPANRRTVRLRLSDAGKKLVPVLAREADENDAAFFGVIGEGERRQLLATVRALLDKNGFKGKALE
ncbi:Organic hydroperoxide resistance transcriptional regulator [Aquisphaera giovannonii]|uniref:Organic hydroperoxide resistance transcriptional regulator n=1 Tax=Aquisphaera giovannonii TaxID=406548 RepID=A0A5B9W7P0_9BACT|nr:MarR family transcriptional regulator [Aquisphaera giovannonii]QEH36573.1 Organic hydroperoxide resistance transcriptional regulator [Aquisphaera giovannonii]